MEKPVRKKTLFSFKHILFLKYTGNDVGPLGKLRTFLSNPHCREALDLRKGKTYLIMGDSERRTDEQSQAWVCCVCVSVWFARHSLTCRGEEDFFGHPRRPNVFSPLSLLRYEYVLGERTWVEYWPTEAECKSQKHKLTCSGMLEMVQKYTQHGCEQ